MRGNIQGTKKDSSNLQEKNVRLYHVEGEKNAELAALRGDTSKQLSINQDLEAEIERIKQLNTRLRDECEDL